MERAEGQRTVKTLIIAEKPDMGRNIAAAIEPKAVNKRTHLEGQQYVITWAIGHLIGLAEPDHYDDKYKKWRFDDLPIIPDEFKLLPNPKTRDQLKVIAELARTCDRIVNACDAGREGQLIFSYIQRHLRLTQPVQRLWISDLTAETIRSGFAALKDGAEYDNLTRAARSRSEADWLIGMNGSRAFTTKHNVLLSVGRVQTPVLALIYDRQKQVEAFSSLKFYELSAHFEQAETETEYRGMWQGERLTDPERAEALRAKVHGKPGRIASYEAKETKEYPQKLYDLTLLQREANGKFGFSAKKTLDTAQALYEKHKVITYPRTNSNYVTEQNIPEMHRALNVLQGTAYDELARGANRSLVHKGNKFVCNPTKVEDHHAILPTAKRASGLTPDEQKLYDLIVRRFLAQFYPAAEYRVHTVLTEVEGETFKTTVKQLLSLGWKVIYAGDANETAAKPKKGGAGKDGKDGKDGEDAEEEVEVSSPFTLDGEAGVLCREAAVKEKETQPPKPYTEGTLLKAMESAGRSIEDEEVRDAMKDSGLGTPATRAATIERLKNVGYVTMQGKRIAITAKGRTAIELIRAAGIDLLTSPEMTGQWERRLNEIAKGQASDDAFMGKVKTFASLIVDKVRGQARMAKTAFEGEAVAASSGGAGRGQSGRGSGAGGRGKRTAPAHSDDGSARAATAVQDDNAGKQRTLRAAPPRTDAPRTAPAVVAACPRPGCGGSIFMGKKGYGCSNYRSGCGFVIWKESFGRLLSDTQVKALIEKGRTAKLKLTADDGASFDGRIVLTNLTTGQLAAERE
jgi:DNA topoisomerase-3